MSEKFADVQAIEKLMLRAKTFAPLTLVAWALVATACDEATDDADVGSDASESEETNPESSHESDGDASSASEASGTSTTDGDADTSEGTTTSATSDSTQGTSDTGPDESNTTDDTETSGGDSGEVCPGAKQPIPCVDGMSDGYPCKGIAKLSYLTEAELGGGATDIWGWHHGENREFALVATYQGLVVVEITDGCEPVVLGILPANGTNSTHYDVKVAGNYAVVVSEKNGHGMQIFDLRKAAAVTNPPATFEAESIYNGWSRAHNVVVNEEAMTVYGVGGDTYGGGLHAVDISDPKNPKELGGWDGANVHDAACVTYHGPDSEHLDREICITSNSGKGDITIIDMTDPSSPVELSDEPYPGASFSHQGWLTEDHQYYIHGDEFDERNHARTRTMIYDVRDLDEVKYIATFESPTEEATDHNQYIRGDFLYQGNYMSGLRVLDISGVAEGQLQEIGYFDTTPNQGGTSMNGIWSVYPYYRSGKLAMTEADFGLWVVLPPPFSD